MSVNHPKTGMARRLRSRLNEPGIITLPGVFNAAVARVAMHSGFEAAYITGAGLINGVTALPDIGLLSPTEITRLAGYIADAVDIPVICDADTGYGEALQVMRTVQLFEQAGVAGIHLEDQVSPKRCGHLGGKQVIDIDSMQAKIAAACSARKDSDFLIIARVDSRSVNGMDDAIARAHAYVEAGADMIFPEAMETREEFAQMARAVSVPMMANMTEFGKSPYLSCKDFEALGYRMVIFPMTAFRVMMKAVEVAFDEIRREGTQTGLLDRMQTREELYRLLDYAAYDDLDKQFSAHHVSPLNRI